MIRIKGSRRIEKWIDLYWWKIDPSILWNDSGGDMWFDSYGKISICLSNWGYIPIRDRQSNIYKTKGNRGNNGEERTINEKVQGKETKRRNGIKKLK